MPVFESRIDPRSERFVAQRTDMLERVARLRELESKVRAHSARAKARFAARGQFLPRDRLALLLDPGRPFLEMSTLAGLGMHDDDGDDGAQGGGSIAGIGFVGGVRVVVAVTDSGIKGGSVSPMGLRKSLRLQEIALENRLPVITLAESAGANLLYQDELFIEGGRTFANQARLSAAGVPQITVVHGSSTAGGAYLPGLSDYVIVVRNRSKIFLAGPPLLRAATGEIAGEEELGGAEMHATVAGTAEHLAEDDGHAIELAREVLAKLAWTAGPGAAARPGRPPRYDPEGLCGVAPVDYQLPYDVREIVARVVDDSDFLDFKSQYGPHTVCARAEIEGHPVGVLGNNGPIDTDGAVKAAQFIQLCCQSRTPLVFLQNTTGYLVGRDAEERGIVKHGAKMIQAVANATVPKITLVVGGSWGAGNYGMAGRGLSPRFIFSWPNARVGVMGPEQAATVLEIITRAKIERQSGQDAPQDFLDALKKQVVERMEPQTSVFYGTARLWDDGVIDPRDSRRVLAFCLATCREAEARTLAPNTFGVARM